VLYAATWQRAQGDAEMEARVQAHRLRRPAGWSTLEVGPDPAADIARAAAGHAALLLDCLATLVGGWVWEAAPLPADAPLVPAEAAARADRLADERLGALLRTLAALPCPAMVVSNEVGWGVVPPTPLGRLYRDVLGRCNQRAAAAADEVHLLVAGLPLRIKPVPGAGP
jgi:adenosylcobinamide kinase/adenosylcobinamide-phosphate guanylyltransferase